MKSYRDIIAWQKAINVVEAIYQVTTAFPDHERYGLVSQMRRASVSIPSNIAEGFGRYNRPDFLKFLRTSRGSLFELQTQLEIAYRLQFCKPNTALDETLAETDRVLQGFIRGLEEAEPNA